MLNVVPGSIIELRTCSSVVYAGRAGGYVSLGRGYPSHSDVRVLVPAGVSFVAWCLSPQEAQQLMDELNESWEDKLKKTQAIQKERYVGGQYLALVHACI